MHEVTAAALYVRLHKAYNSYKEDVDNGGEPNSFSDWHKQAELDSPQFHYWSLTLHFLLTTLIFVLSLGEENFQLHKNACQSLAPWYFFFLKTTSLHQIAASSYSRYGMS